MDGRVTNVERDTLANEDYLRVLCTGPISQLVFMTSQAGEEFGREAHGEHDQFVPVEAGIGKEMLNGEETVLGDGSVVVIPAVVEHNVIKTPSDSLLRLLYAVPPAGASGRHCASHQARGGMRRGAALCNEDWR